MPQTVVLHPLDESEKGSILADVYEKIICLIDAQQTDHDFSFENFLAHLELTYGIYIPIHSDKAQSVPKTFCFRE